MLLGRDTDEDETPFGLFAMSIRLPANVAALLSAMADQGGISRNEMTNLVIQAGIDAILEETPDESKAQLHMQAEDTIEHFLS